MKKKRFDRFHKLMMIRFHIFLSIMLLLFSGGCGMQQKEQTEDVRQLATTDSVVCFDGNQDTEAVKKQLELFVKNFDQWRIDDGKNKDLDIVYALTDLDRNGRLEIMALSVDWQEDTDDGYILRKCFEVNSAGDGLEKIGTEQIQDVPLGYDSIGKFCTAYFDPETGEYHYVMEAAKDYDEDGDCEDYTDIISLTMKDGQITQTTLGTYECKGKEYQYFRVDAEEKTELTKEEYCIEKLGSLSYPDCQKFDVWFSTFTFSHDLEEHIYHAMEKAYQECFQGYPLEKQEKEIYGYSVSVPQYTVMQDLEKQKRLNQMICEQVEQSLGEFYDLPDAEFDLQYADITVKYAGWNRLSLLLEARGYHEGAVTANEHCDTINIDLGQEKLLSGLDILPKEEREEIVEEIEDASAIGFHGGDDYQKNLEENNADLFPTMRAEGWQDVKIYQTRDDVGVVIPTKFGLDAYVIFEPRCDWAWYTQYGNSWIHYPDVDWEAYQYKMLPAEYQSLQAYMPVLTGGQEFTLTEERWTDEDEREINRQNMTIDGFVKWYTGGDEDLSDEDLILDSISICDMTQDGHDELVMEFANLGRFFLILHKEGDAYYGIYLGKRAMRVQQKNGVYGSGKNGLYLYQLRFEEDTLIENYIGGYEIRWDSETDKEQTTYYIGENKVEKSAYKKWEKSIAAEEVLWYAPERLPEKREAAKAKY